MAPTVTDARRFLSGAIPLRIGPHRLCEALRRSQSASLLLDGGGGFSRPWETGRLVAVEPRVRLSLVGGEGGTGELTAMIDSLVDARRGVQGSARTGIAVLLAYDAPIGPTGVAAGERERDSLRALIVEVDRSVCFDFEGRPVLTVLAGGKGSVEDEWRRLAARLGPLEIGASRQSPARIRGELHTSLPRGAYLEAVKRIRALIAEGEIYQANLCQRFTADYVGDEFALYRELARRCPAPRSAFFEAGEVALASVSPEIFLTVRPPDRISTHPIKGTRPRGLTPEQDDAQRQALLASEKDRAELLMIVDLERNDLGRICRTATVDVPELLSLRSFPAVHHLVARVEGRLRHDVGAARLIRAMFPGGSITGAPKIRAMEVLSRIEPVRRGFFSGSLLWFGDDGSVDSSILIRTVEFQGGQAYVGAGGGIVTDSDPEQEWRESNHKAAALTRALGFAPEDAR